MNFGDAMCFVPSWLTKGSKKSLEIESAPHNSSRAKSTRPAQLPAPGLGKGGPVSGCHGWSWWVPNRERMGSVHEDQGRALLCRALRLQAALQVPLDQHLSYLWAPRGPSAVFDRFLLLSQCWVLCRFIVGYLKPP